MTHLDDETLLEAALDGAAGSAAAHLATCPDCRSRLAALREDLERLAAMDGAALDEAAPPLPRRAAWWAPRPWLLKAAALVAAAGRGGLAGARWLDGEALDIVPYAAPAPAARAVLAYVACPAGDLAVTVDTLSSRR